MRRLTNLLLALLLATSLVPAVADAQTQTGTVEGKITDPQGGVLPGVTVTLTGARGVQTTVSEASGDFRFVGLQPDTYRLKAELAGFLSQQVDAVVVGMAKTVTVDLSLKLGGITENVDVRAAASTVDVKGASTDTNLSNDLLTLMPIYSPTSIDLLNYAPGINNRSAYGSQGSYGNALLLDGVDTRDPEGGSAWTFFNQNLIQEVQIGGLGAPAEFGGFTGAIINTVTKSGSNAYSGLFTMRYTRDSFASDNISSSVLAANPSLGEAEVTKNLTDYTVQLGGPLKQDKAFFFASVQRYSTKTDPTGPVANSTQISPRFNLKFTFQPSVNDTIVAGMQYDSYNLTGRVGNWPAAQATDRQTVEEDAPEWVWNFQWRKIFGASAFLEAKFTGYNGYYNLDPVDPSPYTFDGLTGEYCCGGGGGLLYNDRSRNQVQVALTKYAEKFGRHSLKFGLEIERSHLRNIGQPYGPSNFYTYSYGGVPYFQYSYSYDVQADNKRTSAFVQDQWTAGKLTLNLGVRLDHIRGRSPILNEDVYTPGNAWGPRIGVAYDLTGKGLMAVKAYYGRYFEGAAGGFFESAVPGVEDFARYRILSNGQLGPPTVLIPGIVYGIDSGIKHPRTDEFNVSYETQLTSTLRLTATGIWRETNDFINNVIANARWRPVTLNNALTGQPFTGYFWANSASSNDSFFIRNTEGFQYLATDGSVIATADPNRSYKGLMLLLNSSLKKRFGYQLSYVLSKATGNVDNTGLGNWVGGTAWGSPNTGIINADGELTNSRRHEIKAYVSYEVPRSMFYWAGRTLAITDVRTRRTVNTRVLNLATYPRVTRRQIFLEPRGTEKNDFYNNFDLRIEKAFEVSGHRFGVFADIFNMFNTATVTTRQARYPNTTISGSTVAYKAPTAVQGARQLTIGGRWLF